MEEVQIRVADLNIRKYAATLTKRKPERIIDYAAMVAASMSVYFMNGAVCMKAELEPTLHAACVRIYLAKMELPVPQQIGYSFFIDGIVTHNTEIGIVVSQRLTEFTALVDAKMKDMGYGVKWVPPTEKQPPTEVIATMTFEDICTLLLRG